MQCPFLIFLHFKQSSQFIFVIQFSLTVRSIEGQHCWPVPPVVCNSEMKEIYAKSTDPDTFASNYMIMGLLQIFRKNS